MLTVDWESNSHLFHWKESPRLKAAMENKTSEIPYTMPGIKSDQPLPTDASDELKAFYEQHFFRIDLQLNQTGFTNLLSSGNLELALNATTRLLSQSGQGVGRMGKPSMMTEAVLQLWSLRFQLAMALQLHQTVIDEMAAFDVLDAPDLYYEYYPKSGRTGSMVPFSLRLIHSEILRFTPFPCKSIERTRKLRKDVCWVISDLSSKNMPDSVLEAWRERLFAVDKLHAGLLYSLGEYSQSMHILSFLKDGLKENQKAKLYQTMMRMAITMGDEKSVLKYLEESASCHLGSDLILHKALRSIFMGSYPHASDYLMRLVKSGDSNQLTANTLAISLLYSGNVREAVMTLNACPKPLSKPLLTNLKALAELGHTSTQKESMLLAAMERS